MYIITDHICYKWNTTGDKFYFYYHDPKAIIPSALSHLPESRALPNLVWENNYHGGLAVKKLRAIYGITRYYAGDQVIGDM